MEDIIRSLYYMVDDWMGQHKSEDEETKKLLARQDALKEEIISRLGENGQEMMEALSNLNLELEDIHDEALFRAAMQLGTQIAQPAAQRADNVRPYSTSR